jgi:hypothetical protein
MQGVLMLLTIQKFQVRLIGLVMVFNPTFNNISVYSGSQISWWRKPEYLEKDNDLSQVTDKPAAISPAHRVP